MRVFMAIAVLLMVGCAEASWVIPPTISPESSEDVAAWMIQVHDAIDSWQSVLPNGCEFPMQIGDGGMPVVLLTDAAWLAQDLGETTAGHFFKERELIYVRGSTKNDCVGLVAHELGHAAGWLKHNSDPTSVMYYVGDGKIRPTVDDGTILASILGCR